MNVGLKTRPSKGGTAEPLPQTELSCTTCKWLELGHCLAPATSDADSIKLHQAFHSVPARRIICREQDLYDAVPVICDGWAASIVMLSDGSRQILSFLLPGDLVSTALLFEPRPHRLVEAITDVRYGTFKRSALRTMLLKRSDLFDKLAKA
jgi:CRP/FNR family transcriptional regulator